MNGKRPALKERDVLRQVLDYLRRAKIVHWRANTGAAKIGTRFVRFGEPGVPDVIAVLRPDGRFAGIEVKREEGGRLTDAQRAALDNIAREGGLAIVVSSVEQLRAALRAEGVECP